MKKGLKAAIIAAVCVVGAGSGAYCLFTPDTVNVVIAEKTDISPVLSGIGKIEGSRKITVYSDVDGFVSERFIVAGDRVKTGDVLIGYRDDTQQKLIAAAETDVKYSKKTLDDINALRTEYQNAVNTANAQIADCEKRYSEIESQIRTLTSDNYSTEYSQAEQRNTNDTDITALELQIQDKQTELSKAELEFKEIELLGTDDTETLQTKLSSLTERIRGYQSDISALNEQIAKLQSDSLAISSEGMKPDTYSQYLSLQNDLEAVMRKWTDAKTQKETAQSMLSAYNTIGAYEQQLAQDELSLSYAENELEKSKAGTSAPVDGIITECLVDAGAYRLQQIIISVIATAFVIIICGVLFGGRLKKISNQLFNYSNADYNILYTLNYDAMLNNTCVYPDTDILVYLDNSKTKRIAASLVMKKPEAQYNLNYLQKLNTIGKDQVLLPSNLREKYNLNVGDTVYIEYPYKSELCAVTIGSITNYEYDYCNPNIANDIGVAFIDADNGYIENTNCKYILFSKSSQADTLADYPQIINDIVNKGTNQSKVFKQGVPALVFSILLSIGSIVISNIVFFSKSLGIFKRLYLKGAKRKSLVAISFGEKIVLSIIPLIISECLMSLIIPINSVITVLFFLIPLLVFSLYTIVSTVVISGKLKAKG